jgi:Fe-S-cluster-containing dehydrogenase component
MAEGGNAGRCLVIAGEEQPPSVHVLAHALNQKLGNVGKTVVYTAPVPASPGHQVQLLSELVADMRGGKVNLLVILGGNPVYNAPADLGFAEAMKHVSLCVHLSPFEDETSLYCQWHLPESHFLEAWSDGRAFDGTASVVQPLIAPLYDTRSAHEVLALFSGREDSGHDIVRQYWANHGLPEEPEWLTALHDGVIPNTAFPAKPVRPASPPAAQSMSARPGPGLGIVFRADSTLYDGRFANNGWLQELPKPLTRITWDNVAWISSRTAAQNRLEDWELVELQYAGRSVKAPVFIMPGQPDDVVTVHLGYGRTKSGPVGTGVGYDAFRLRTSDAPWFGRGVTLRGTGEPYRLASFQLQENAHQRNQARAGTLAEFMRNPAFAHEENPEESLYPGYPYREYKWGMVIDDTACVGCAACVVACQAENNIPVVGKDQVARGRAMHWIRIDRYFQNGQEARPDVCFEPVPCMQCENAPCELVCPVDATLHSDEGLNQMVYNRCVGTRYCSNNCPYKVRRFNFYQFADKTTESLKPLRNPNVTVRSRGIMEKCTYCIQRIQSAKINAQIHNTKVRDGEITPACAQACPTAAIVFGDLNDPESRVARLQAQPHNYGILMELNTRPRTTYLPRILNPNTRL